MKQCLATSDIIIVFQCQSKAVVVLHLPKSKSCESVPKQRKRHRYSNVLVCEDNKQKVLFSKLYRHSLKK